MKTKLIPILLLPFLVLPGCSIARKRDHRSISIGVSPDQKQLVFSAEGRRDTDLFLLDLETKKARLLLSLPGNELAPQFSPDGKKIVFASATRDYKSSTIYQLDLASNQVTKLVDNGPFYDTKPVYGSDDSEVYFNRAHRRRPYSFGGYVWDQWDIYKLKQGKLTRLSRSLYYQLYRVNFEKKSHAVFFSAHGDKETKIHRLDPSGELSVYRNRGFYYSLPRNAGSGVYINDNNADYDFEVYSCSDQGKDLKLTNLKSYLTDLCISEDGKTIFFLSEINRNNRCDLYSVQSDGTHLKKLVGSDFFDNLVVPL